MKNLIKVLYNSCFLSHSSILEINESGFAPIIRSSCLIIIIIEYKIMINTNV